MTSPVGARIVPARSRWRLPSIRCDACGEVWGRLGWRFPCVDLSAVPGQERYLWENAVAVSRAEFLEWCRYLSGAIPDEACQPSALLGPATGIVTGELDDFVWIGANALAARNRVLRLSRDAGLTGIASVALTNRPDYEQLELRPFARLVSRIGLPVLCDGCGRVGRPQEPVVFDRRSLRGLDIVRPADVSSMILASERVVELVRREGWSGLRFREVAVE